MRAKCGSKSSACLASADCRDVASCFVQERCADPTNETLACLCGVSVSQTASSFAGAWNEVIQTKIGLSGVMDIFNGFLIQEGPVRQANRAVACMATECTQDCVLNIPEGPMCGNGKKEASEACDDGNRANGDGCSVSCQSEPRCGNGVVEGDEFLRRWQQH